MNQYNSALSEKLGKIFGKILEEKNILLRNLKILTNS